MIYTLDTNVLIDVLRGPADMRLLKAFLEWALPRTTLSSVVASELLAGARTDAARRLVERDLLGAFERRGRIVAPSAATTADDRGRPSITSVAAVKPGKERSVNGRQSPLRPQLSDARACSRKAR